MRNCEKCVFYIDSMTNSGHMVKICLEQRNEKLCPNELSCGNFIERKCANCLDHGNCLFESAGQDQNSCYSYELKQIDDSCYYCSYFDKELIKCNRTNYYIPTNSNVPEEINSLNVTCEKYCKFKEDQLKNMEMADEFFKKVKNIVKSKKKETLHSIEFENAEFHKDKIKNEIKDEIEKI